MIKPISEPLSVKELRMHFPKIRKKLNKGVQFTLIYRSRPIAILSPLESYSKPFADDLNNEANYDLPKDMKDFIKNIDKYAFKAGKPFDAAEEIAKDRDDSYETD